MPLKTKANTLLKGSKEQCLKAKLKSRLWLVRKTNLRKNLSNRQTFKPIKILFHNIRRHLDDIKKYAPEFVPEFIPEFVPEFDLNSDLYTGTNWEMNSGMNSGAYFFMLSKMRPRC